MQAPLIEKFIVVGLDTTKETLRLNDVLENKLLPSFLDIFPFESLDSPSYIDNFKLWCFPDGFSIYGENLVKINEVNNKSQHLNQQPTQMNQNSSSNSQNGQNILSKNALHHFILTNQHSERKYCSGLLIHEEVYLEAPNSMNLANNSTLRGINLLQQPNGLIAHVKVYVPKMICVVSSRPVLEFQKQFLAFIYKFGITSKMLKQPPRLKVYTQLYERFNRLCDEEGSFQAAEISWEETVYAGTLSELNRLSPSDPLAEQFMLKEEYLISFAVSMIFRAHTFSPGISKELVFNLSGEEVCRLRPERDLAMLLEKQIIIIANNPNEIINICEALFSLIYPLKWQCLYIPLLPIELSEMLHALMPYVIGISKQSFIQLERSVDLKDKVLIDLDQDTVQQTETLKLPEYLRMYLVNNLRELSKQFVQGEQQQQQQLHPQKKKELWFQLIFSLKRVFLKSMICFINNFSPYILYSHEFKREQAASQDVFTANEYLEIFDQEEKPFMQEITRNTMMFNKFIEESYKCLYLTEFLQEEPEEQYEIQFYLYCLKKIQKSMPRTSADRKFDILINPLLFSALELELQAMSDQAVMESITQVQQIDLTPHLIKYLKFIESAKPPLVQNQLIQGSAKQLTYAKTIFKKLHKDWLMAPSPPQEAQIILPKGQNHLNQGFNSTQNIHNHQSNTIKLLDGSFNNTSGISSELNDTISKSSARNRITSNHRVNTLNSNNNNINSKDIYNLQEDSADPSIQSTPILFFRNIFLEYDSFETRKFQHEFGKHNIECPLNYLTKQYDIFKEPLNPPSVKDPMEMIFMQEQLQQMLQKAIYPNNNINQENNNNNHNNLHHPSRALQPVESNISSLNNIASGIESHRNSNRAVVNDTQNSKRQSIFKSDNSYDSKNPYSSAAVAFPSKLNYNNSRERNNLGQGKQAEIVGIQQGQSNYQQTEMLSRNNNNLSKAQSSNSIRPPAAPARKQDQNKNQDQQLSKQNQGQQYQLNRNESSFPSNSFSTDQDIDLSSYQRNQQYEQQQQQYDRNGRSQFADTNLGLASRKSPIPGQQSRQHNRNISADYATYQKGQQQYDSSSSFNQNNQMLGRQTPKEQTSQLARNQTGFGTLPQPRQITSNPGKQISFQKPQTEQNGQDSEADTTEQFNTRQLIPQKSAPLKKRAIFM